MPVQPKIYRTSGTFKLILFVFGFALIFVLLLYTQHLVQTLRTEARQILEFYARFYVRAVSEADDDELNFIFEEIIKRTDFPIIQTDVDGNPTGWKGIDIPPNDFSEEALERVRAIKNTMAKEIEPIPLKYENYHFGYLYYGDSRAIQQLIWLPYVEIIMVGLFIMIGFLGFNSIRRSEQQFIWVGMAKETAHQLGTPLSSLMGWIELLRAQLKDEKQQTILAEIQQDVERLNKVAQRFSQIGSRAELKPQRLDTIIAGVISYFERRLPQMGKRVQIHLESHLDAEVPVNPDLFEWVLENLIKNALDAIGNREGHIYIRILPPASAKQRVIIDIQDTGKGISPQDRKNIFRPGFSTKTRGWGLGLSLARRIIESYHGGRLLLKETAVGQGTTMRIIL